MKGMKIIVIGDIHGDYDAFLNYITKTDADLYLQVGDLAGDKDFYPDVPKPTLFIMGNHEALDKIVDIKEPTEISKNLVFIPNGTYINIKGLKIGGFGGNFSPISFQKAKKDLSGKRRSHFTLEEYLSALKMPKLDILLTHEAPSPFIIKTRDMRDRGSPLITSLIYKLKPRYHFFGHHHVDKCIRVCNTLSCCVKTIKEIILEDETHKT